MPSADLLLNQAALTKPTQSGGNKQYLERLYQCHAPALLRYACSKGASQHDAEELVQELFIRLSHYENAQQLHNEMAFLRTVVVNLLRDRHRRNQHAPQWVEYDESNHEHHSQAPEPEAQLSQQQAVAQAEADLAQLPALTRRIFLLNRIQSLSYEDIATQLNIGVMVVRRHLRDALMYLTQRRMQREQQ
ncbi:hypothetical protein GCM10009092_02290 [Bowmanella denitrificans]|uniref:Uncharacterized protein n=1 Tax=Bowmanella denitrificans TaxID=366582 RepID=A0ABN0WM56_9ALTE